MDYHEAIYQMKVSNGDHARARPQVVQYFNFLLHHWLGPRSPNQTMQRLSLLGATNTSLLFDSVSLKLCPFVQSSVIGEEQHSHLE